MRIRAGQRSRRVPQILCSTTRQSRHQAIGSVPSEPAPERRVGGAARQLSTPTIGRSYAGRMAAEGEKRWIAPPRWTGGVTDRLERMYPRTVGNPDEGVARLQAKLDRRVRGGKADSWRSVNLMEMIANRMESAGRFADALPLRENVLARRTEHLGAHHRLTQGAEWKLAHTIRNLEDPKGDGREG
jgi:hypothetical protein